MIDNQTERDCRKILTYGMCLDMVQNVACNVKREKKLSPRNINNTYRTFVNTVRNK